MDQNKIGSFLKELRKEKGLTQEQLAEQLNIAGRTVSRWETGNSLPDVSLLVELADLYDVDIREIIDGERKGENMTEETRNVLGKVSEYVDEDKQKRAKWVRNTSIVGLVSLVLALLIQTGILFRTSEWVPTIIGIVMTFVAFITLLVVALYANGVTKELKIAKGIRAALIVIGVLLSSYLVTSFVWVVGTFVLSIGPSEKLTGIEAYNKKAFVSEYGSDMDCGLYLFPDSVDIMSDITFEGDLDTNLFDTTGYLILSGKYSQEDFRKEIQRMSEVSCHIKGVTKGVIFDESSYDLPSYVASDGYDASYEYALIDEKTCTITYVFLSCPDVDDSSYRDYLKKDKASYKNSGVDRFTIYAHSFDNGETYIEFDD